MPIVYYFAKLKPGKCVLWCYLVWYLVTIYFHFDPAPKIWINALGISAIIGCGLRLSVATAEYSKDHWQTRRLFLMPFCVSSFSALIKDQGFLFIFSSDLQELGLTALTCVIFILSILLIKAIVKVSN